MASAATTQQQNIEAQLKDLFGQLLGIDLKNIVGQSTFLEVGADSLLLLQASQRIQSTFGVKVPFRALLEQYASFEELAQFLEQKLLANVSSHLVEEHQPVSASSTQRASEGEGRQPFAFVAQKELVSIQAKPQANRQVANGAEKVSEEDNWVVKPEVEHILKQQLRIMGQQLEVLRSLTSGSQSAVNEEIGTDATAQDEMQRVKPSMLAPETVTVSRESAGTSNPRLPASEASQLSPALSEDLETRSLRVDPETYVPYQPRKVARLNGLTEQQKLHIDALLERYAERTRKSKQYAQEGRLRHADNRGTAGFNLTFKEVVYPLVIKHAEGAHVWDADDNEYVDITMGFGALLFGHSPKFLMEAIEEQLKHGIGLGLQSHLAGKAAQLLCELTGMERASFCNSGTEAVMTALRLARAVTGRSKVMVFGGAFHGTFDGVLVRGQETSQHVLETIPLAPGITSHLIGDVLLGQFGHASTLDLLRTHAHELAAVLVELPQSRRPDLVPLAFVQEVRKITAEAGIALVFDEVVSGFRSHPGGAQALFGIKADLAAYGKAFGGGLPVAAIAGKAEYMSAVDGGAWNYGDESYPEAIQTFFAGTYFKHPLLMPAVCATLEHFKKSGPQLQERLNQRTEALAHELDRFFEDEEAPIRTMYFGSLFRFTFPPHYKGTDANVFYYHLLENGVNLPETRNGFLSTAHSTEDIEHIIWAVKDAFQRARSGGFLTDGLEAPSRGVTSGSQLVLR